MQSELFETHQEHSRIWKISEINSEIRKVLEKNFSQIWIKGEISNLRAHSSGHYYFQLKDSKAQIKAVLFRGDARNLASPPEEGSEYLAFGDITSYEARGDCQIRVRHLMQEGVGNLRLEFERLKRQLQAEGLFDPERKQEIPLFPTRIGLITSPEGAAIHDFLTILERRNWRGEVFLLPSLVQGPKAPENLVNSVKQSGKIRPNVDLIVLSRGGGSVEDLWAFNDEALVREIADSKIPIISAIGHETDFVLCDFAADLRAETPSGAAELISSNYLSQIEKFSFLKDRLMDTKSLYFQSIRDQYELLSAKLKLFSPINKIERQSQQIDDLEIRLRHSAERIFEKKSEKIHYLAKSLEASNLQRTLEKGFTIVRNQKGKIIKDGGGLVKNEKVFTTFRDGDKEMSVE